MTEQRKTGRMEELDEFNALACLLVILIHVLSLGVTMLERGAWQLAPVYFLWKLSGFVVPAFLFSGAVKLGRALAEGQVPPYGVYIWRRIRKIYLPYLAASLLYVAVYRAIGVTETLSLHDLLCDLLLGRVSSQFYYIVLVMQFYLLLPLWKCFLARVSPCVALPLGILVSFFMLRSDYFLRGTAFAPYYFRDRIFLSYLFFWLWGLYSGAHYDMLRRRLQRMSRLSVALACGAVLGFVCITYVQLVTDVYVYDGNDMKLFSDALSILLLLYGCIRLRGLSCPRLHGTLRRIYGASYSVFLSHCLFLTVGTIYLQRFGVVRMGALLPLRAAICYTLPFALHALLRRFRTAR